MSRETLYHEKLPKELLDYFYGSNEIEIDPVTNKSRLKEFATIEKFCSDNGFSRSVFYDWLKVHDELKLAHDRCMMFQEHTVVSNALSGRFQQTFAIFYMKNKHGYKDSQEVTNINPPALVVNCGKPANAA